MEFRALYTGQSRGGLREDEARRKEEIEEYSGAQEGTRRDREEEVKK